MKIFWAKIRRFFYLLPNALRGECAVTGYADGECALIAAVMLIGPGRYVLTRVFYTTTRRKEGETYELHYQEEIAGRDKGIDRDGMRE